MRLTSPRAYVVVVICATMTLGSCVRALFVSWDQGPSADAAGPPVGADASTDVLGELGVGADLGARQDSASLPKADSSRQPDVMFTGDIGVDASAKPDYGGPSEFNPVHCGLVAGTLHIHWEAVRGPFKPCTAIEYTDGTAADAADGILQMSGVSVSDSSCISEDRYTLRVSADGLSVTGQTMENIPFDLARRPGEACFVGHWISSDKRDDFLGHISIKPFGLTP